MKYNKSILPVLLEANGSVMRRKSGFGSMDANYHTLVKGTDFTPLLKGLPNDSCHCPHWGYIIKGSMLFIYDDGTEEVFSEGDLYYAPAGHTAMAEEDLELIDFSPTKEHEEVLAHVAKVMESAAS